VDVIGIDEGQFFPDLVEVCEKLAAAGKTVLVASLDGTFQRKPFGRTLELIPMAESVTKLQAVCMICFRDAAFSRRLGDETAIEVIGGADKYVAVCRECFFKPYKPELANQPSPKKQKVVGPPPGSAKLTRAFPMDVTNSF